MPAKQNAAESSEVTQEQETQKAAEARDEWIKTHIVLIAEGVSEDFDRHGIYGRVMSVLASNGVTDEEIAKHSKAIGKAADEVYAKRVQENQIRAERIAARRQKSVDEILGA